MLCNVLKLKPKIFFKCVVSCKIFSHYLSSKKFRQKFCKWTFSDAKYLFNTCMHKNLPSSLSIFCRNKKISHLNTILLQTVIRWIIKCLSTRHRWKTHHFHSCLYYCSLLKQASIVTITVVTLLCWCYSAWFQRSCITLVHQGRQNRSGRPSNCQTNIFGVSYYYSF